MTDRPFKLATAQISVSNDVAQNGDRIRKMIEQAGTAGARLIHFPEAALSGYVKAQIMNWADVDWMALASELEETAQAARKHKIWVVLGCNHQLTEPNDPHNSLYIINDRGAFVARYDKQLCSHSEITSWYSPGSKPLVFDVDGVRFGCALCIEINFPELFSIYETYDIDCLLYSAYAEDLMFAVKAQAHASNCCYWVSSSVVTNPHLSSQFIGPTGEIMAQCAPATDGLIYNLIDKSDTRWEVPIKYARPWRRKARSGEIYATSLSRAQHDERSRFMVPFETPEK